MAPEYIIYLIFVTLSAASVGLLAMSAILDLKMAPHLFALNDWRALTKVGTGMIVGILLWLVIPTKQVPSSTGAWIYISGLGLVAVGGFGVVVQSIRLYVELTVRKEDPLHELARDVEVGDYEGRISLKDDETRVSPNNEEGRLSKKDE